MPFAAPANFVQNKYVKLRDLDCASATNAQGNNTIFFFGVEDCADCKQLDSMFRWCVKWLKPFIMHADLTFIASAVAFSPQKPHLSYASHDWMMWSILSYRASGRTRLFTTTGTGEVDLGDGTPDSKKIKWFGLSCWCCPVQEPWVLDTDNHTESKQWPPPLLWMDEDAVLVHILVHPINTPHCLALVLRHERLGDLHSLCFSSGPALCYLGRYNPNFGWSYVDYDAVMPVYHNQTWLGICGIVTVPSLRHFYLLHRLQWTVLDSVGADCSCAGNIFLADSVNQFEAVNRLSNVSWKDQSSSCCSSDIRSTMTDPPMPRPRTFTCSCALVGFCLQQGVLCVPSFCSQIVCDSHVWTVLPHVGHNMESLIRWSSDRLI